MHFKKCHKWTCICRDKQSFYFIYILKGAAFVTDLLKLTLWFNFLGTNFCYQIKFQFSKIQSYHERQCWSITVLLTLDAKWTGRRMSLHSVLGFSITSKVEFTSSHPGQVPKFSCIRVSCNAPTSPKDIGWYRNSSLGM